MGRAFHICIILPLRFLLYLPRPNQMRGSDATSTVALGEGSVTVLVEANPFAGTMIHLHAATRSTRFEVLETTNSWLSAIASALQPRCAGPCSPQKWRHDYARQRSKKSWAVQTPSAIEKCGAAEMEMIYSNICKSYLPVFKDR